VTTFSTWLAKKNRAPGWLAWPNDRYGEGTIHVEFKEARERGAEQTVQSDEQPHL
jgi:hypothetical protein